MLHSQAALEKPAGAIGDRRAEAWFGDAANVLLNESRLIVGDQPFRLVEIEFYYFAEDHPDCFAHCDPNQLEMGRWYFHRRGGSYRGGSFKGLDLTFGDGVAFGGILLRTMAAPDGSLINGPSLLVNRLLAETGHGRIADLDAVIDSRTAWESGSPLSLAAASGEDARTVHRTARVGLSLKTAGDDERRLRYVLRRYRYLTEPRGVKKGKLHTVLALHADGAEPAEIQRLTGSPRAGVTRYLADFEQGRQAADFAPHVGEDLNSQRLCRLHGVWHARMASDA
ncbi:MAG: hypothetical protein N2C14_04765 [Planctomycetales bacterium]